MQYWEKQTLKHYYYNIGENEKQFAYILPRISFFMADGTLFIYDTLVCDNIYLIRKLQ